MFTPEEAKELRGCVVALAHYVEKGGLFDNYAPVSARHMRELIGVVSNKVERPMPETEAYLVTAQAPGCAPVCERHTNYVEAALHVGKLMTAGTTFSFRKVTE